MSLKEKLLDIDISWELREKAVNPPATSVLTLVIEIPVAPKIHANPPVQFEKVELGCAVA